MGNDELRCEHSPLIMIKGEVKRDFRWGKMSLACINPAGFVKGKWYSGFKQKRGKRNAFLLSKAPDFSCSPFPPQIPSWLSLTDCGRNSFTNSLDERDAMPGNGLEQQRCRNIYTAQLIMSQSRDVWLYSLSTCLPKVWTSG